MPREFVFNVFSYMECQHLLYLPNDKGISQVCNKKMVNITRMSQLVKYMQAFPRYL